MNRNRRRTRPSPSGTRRLYVAVAVIVVVVAISALYLSDGQRPSSTRPTGSTSTSTSGQKPVILYVNQGNGVVDQTNFIPMLSFATAHAFNTIFFQIYRGGSLLFSQSELSFFVQSAHARSVKIFFALYFTSSSQQIPTSIYALGEDGINLDMSSLPSSAQSGLLTTLQANYQGGQTAVTSTDFSTTLRPDLLILETYGSQYDTPTYIHPGIIGSVGVFATTSEADYQQQLQYALSHSNGVMVFDYARLSKSGY